MHKNRTDVVVPDEFIEQRQLTDPQGTSLPRYVSTMHPSKETGAVFKSIRRNAVLTAVLSVVVFALSYLENEIFYAHDFKSSLDATALRGIVMLLCLAQAMLVYRFYLRVLALRVAYSDLYPSSKAQIGILWHIQDLRKHCLVEIGISLICIPPGVDVTFTYTQMGQTLTLSLDDKLLFVAVLKVYFILKLFYILSPYFTKRAFYYW
jgi:hypothetical protein